VTQVGGSVKGSVQLTGQDGSPRTRGCPCHSFYRGGGQPPGRPGRRGPGRHPGSGPPGRCAVALHIFVKYSHGMHGLKMSQCKIASMCREPLWAFFALSFLLQPLLAPRSPSSPSLVSKPLLPVGMTYAPNSGPPNVVLGFEPIWISLHRSRFFGPMPRMNVGKAGLSPTRLPEGSPSPADPRCLAVPSVTAGGLAGGPLVIRSPRRHVPAALSPGPGSCAWKWWNALEESRNALLVSTRSLPCTSSDTELYAWHRLVFSPSRMSRDPSACGTRQQRVPRDPHRRTCRGVPRM